MTYIDEQQTESWPEYEIPNTLTNVDCEIDHASLTDPGPLIGVIVDKLTASAREVAGSAEWVAEAG
jgi:hypothetical protein